MILYLLLMTMFVQPLQNLNENKADQKVNEKRTFVNPVFDGADPWFIKKDNYYYYCFSSNNSISISRSKYLTITGEPVQVWKAPAEGWNKSCIWAPELHFINDRWYIYYAASVTRFQQEQK